LYFTTFRIPREGFTLPEFKNPVKKIHFLSDAAQQSLKIDITNGVRVVRTPRNAPDPMANVLVTEIEGNTVER
jgi:hypothetical protein